MPLISTNKLAVPSQDQPGLVNGSKMISVASVFAFQLAAEVLQLFEIYNLIQWSNARHLVATSAAAAAAAAVAAVAAATAARLRSKLMGFSELFFCHSFSRSRSGVKSCRQFLLSSPCRLLLGCPACDRDPRRHVVLNGLLSEGLSIVMNT